MFRVTLLLAPLLAGMQPTWTEAAEPPPVPREFRAVWVATVENIDWPTRPGLPVAQQQAEAVAILDNAASLRLNAVILQVRTAADALYDSAIEPWSYYLTGEQGKAPEPFYDPLRFWLDEAHRRGLTLHAWINPYCARVAAAKYPDAATHVNRLHPDRVRAYGSARWLDPGDRGAIDQTLRVVTDIVRRYDVDGLHIDDYFYPYPIPDPDHPGEELPFPDHPTWTSAIVGGFSGSRDNWRRQNINQLIEGMAATVRRERPTALFGISPFGIVQPGQPAGVVGFDPYDKLYADAALWLDRGWCDYVAPQLYWKVDAPGQPFRPLLNEWIRPNRHGRHVWPGLSTSRVGPGPKGYAPEEIARQIRIIRETPGASGSILFSQKSLRLNRLGLTDQLRDQVNREPALLPLTPWIKADPPGRPEVRAHRRGQDWAIDVEPGAGGASFHWVVQIRRDERWNTMILSTASANSIRIPDAERVNDLRIQAADRLGNLGEPVTVTIP